jgi:hypothetical protein
MKSAPIPSTVVVMPLPEMVDGMAKATKSKKQKKVKKSLKDVYYDEITRDEQHSKKESTVPLVAPLAEDTCSVDSASAANNRKRSRSWNEVYEPKQMLNQSAIILVGFILFGMAMLWPPLILIAFIIGSYLAKYCFRENDYAVSRRQLYQEFIDEGEQFLPEEFRNLILSSVPTTSSDNVEPCIRIEENYWKNARYVKFKVYWNRCVLLNSFA